MQKELLLLLLSATALALNSYSHPIENYQQDCWAVYPFGNLTSGDNITIFIEFPNAATGANPTLFEASILDSSYGSITQPSGFASPVPISHQGNHTLTWTVNSSGLYNLEIVPSDS